jgi:hypothetical protein
MTKLRNLSYVLKKGLLVFGAISGNTGSQGIHSNPIPVVLRGMWRDN